LVPRSTTTGTTTTPSVTTTTTTTTTTLGPEECRHAADIIILLDASGGTMDFDQFDQVGSA